jgi:Ca2+-binding EF-hand superfamily protein
MRGQPTERILKVIGKKVDGDGDGRITLGEIRAFVRGRFWRGLRVVEQVYGQANDAPGGGNPVDEMREYLAEAMFDFHDTDRDGTVTVDEASRVTAEWIAVAQDSEPVREFIDRWKEMEEGGVLECDHHDSIPTWAHSPNGMPTMAAERPGCESAVKTYRTMLGEYGLVGPFEHEEL